MSAPIEMGRLVAPLDRDDHVEGRADAPVTLLEYGDYECPHCGAAYYSVKEVQGMFPDDLRFAFRNFPLAQMHPHATQAACAAEAAAMQGAFWPMHDRLFEHQDELGVEDLAAHAETIGLDLDQFAADLASQEVRDRVRRDFLTGVRSGVNGTPTFFVNGLRHDGSHAVEELVEAIEAALTASPARAV